MRLVSTLTLSVLLIGCGSTSSPITPVPPTPKPARDQFVKVVGSHLALEDGTPFHVQGAAYWDSMYLKYPTVTYPETGVLELVTPYWIYQDFNEAAIEQELVLLRNTLRLNTIKVSTPAWRIWQLWETPRGASDWFQPDGAINPFYLSRLERFIEIARRNDLRVIIQLYGVLSMDWECPNAAGAWEFIVYPLVPRQDCRFSPPGSDLDRKYQVYMRSIILPLKDNPTVIMYDVSNETLLNWPLNGLGNEGNDWFAERMLSFVHRRALEIRALDNRHPLTTGEVTGYFTDHPEWWAYPSPEFGLINDIDNLNGGRPYTLESILDLLSPHVYGFNLNPPHEEYEEAVAAMRARTTKPIIIGEFGYARVTQQSLPDPLALPASQPLRVAALKRIVAMQGSLTEGGVLFNPLSAVPVPSPWRYRVVSLPPPDGRRYAVVIGPPDRSLWSLDFTFTLFTYDGASPLGVRPLPEDRRSLPASVIATCRHDRHQYQDGSSHEPFFLV